LLAYSGFRPLGRDMLTIDDLPKAVQGHFNVRFRSTAVRSILAIQDLLSTKKRSFGFSRTASRYTEMIALWAAVGPNQLVSGLRKV